MGDARRRQEAVHKAMSDRNTFGVAIMKMTDSAVLFGLEPIDAVRALHHALAATTAQYFGAGGAEFVKKYGDALPALVAQYAEALTAKASPLIVLPDGTPAVAANDSDTKH